MPFRPEPPLPSDQTQRTAVVLCNLGTPDAPTAPAVRRYLAEFLGDPRVVEIPKALWWIILHGIILRTRPKKSAEKYASIWTPDGSPLKVWTAKQATLLRGFLGERGQAVTVRYAMRYGNPSIPDVLDELKAEGHSRILILPLYPQYSGTTTASVFDAVYDWAARLRSIPELRFVNRYQDHAGYINALARSITAHWQAHGRPDKLVMSFHGVPERTRTLGDPYHDECKQTTRLLVQRLGLREDQYVQTFQSRFGRAKWLEPATDAVIAAEAAKGTRRMAIAAPGFSADCLETLEELAIRGKEQFVEGGGTDFAALTCLNTSPAGMAMLETLVRRELGGWI